MQRTMRCFAVAAVALLALGAEAERAKAGQGGGHGHAMMGTEMMQRYDADQDGKLTQAEIDQNRASWHAEFDADKNNSLSLDEFRALWLKARGGMIVREFQLFDIDGNGHLTLEEYRQPLSGMVAMRDRNGDGALSQEDRSHRGRHHHGNNRQGMDHGGRHGEGRGEGRDHRQAQPPQDLPATP